MLRYIHLLVVLGALVAVLALAAPVHAQFGSPEVRIKDIAHVQGDSSNYLVGFGLVVGLAGTGDQSIGTGVTNRTVANMLERMSAMNISPEQVRARNVAVVMVTANMLPYAKNGDNIDITVASVGDARSLEGGQLILTQLRAPDNNVYGLAQGAVSVGGINQSGGALSGGSTKNHILAGRIANGATLVRDMPAFASEDTGALTITLNEPDATTASRTAEAIRARGFNAEAVSPSTVRIEIPPSFSGNKVDMIAQVEQLALRPDRVAKVIINERTGTVVMGGDVRLGPVALAHGSLRLLIARPGQSNGGTGSGYGARNSLYTGGFGPSGGLGVGTGGANSALKAQSVMSLSAGTTLRDVTDALNTIGVTPRDLIAIIQALKQAGALDAVLEMQ